MTLKSINNAIESYVTWTKDTSDIFNVIDTASYTIKERFILLYYQYIFMYISSSMNPRQGKMQAVSNEIQLIIQNDIVNVYDDAIALDVVKVGNEIMTTGDFAVYFVVCNLIYSNVDGYRLLAESCELQLYIIGAGTFISDDTDINFIIYFLKICHDCYFYLGEARIMLLSLLRWKQVIPETHPFHSYYLGMLAFALEENTHYAKAQEYAQKALTVQMTDAWARHAYAHVMEMQGDFDCGLATMNETIETWQNAESLACHNFWHCALFYLEGTNVETAYSLLCNKIIPSAIKSNAMLDMVDAISLCWRMYMYVDMTSTSESGAQTVTCEFIYQAASKLHNHIVSDKECNDGFIVTCFNNLHYHMLNLLMKLHTDKNIKDFALLKTYTCDNPAFIMDYNIETTEASKIAMLILKYYASTESSDSVSIEMNIQAHLNIFNFINENGSHYIGGSNAQRDIFWQTYIYTIIKHVRKSKAAKGDLTSYRQVTGGIDSFDFLNERLLLKPKSLLIATMIKKLCL